MYYAGLRPLRGREKVGDVPNHLRRGENKFSLLECGIAFMESLTYVPLPTHNIPKKLIHLKHR